MEEGTDTDVSTSILSVRARDNESWIDSGDERAVSREQRREKRAESREGWLDGRDGFEMYSIAIYVRYRVREEGSEEYLDSCGGSCYCIVATEYEYASSADVFIIPGW